METKEQLRMAARRYQMSALLPLECPINFWTTVVNGDKGTACEQMEGTQMPYTKLKNTNL